MFKKEIHFLGNTKKSMVFVALLWILQSAGRFLFGYLSATTPGGLLDVEVTQATLQIIDTMFLVLGALGLIATAGLLLRRKWGFHATIIASVSTILFDIWGVTIQSSAAMGFVVPAISLVVLFTSRSQLKEMN